MENGTAVASLNGGGAQIMMNTSNTADEEMNGLDLSTKRSNNSSSVAAVAAGPITLTLSTSNGSTPSTPPPGTPINGSPEKGLEPGQISPSSLRRSTRASAIKAQQKIKDGDVPQAMEQDNSVESEDESTIDEAKSQEPLDGESAAKKRKLENGKALDQFSHEFSIKMEEDGGVYMLDEGSELSSLNETEIETLKKCYDKLLARELTAEQKEERTRMIKQAEADLRNEEAKLTMLKKMRASQIPKHNPTADLQRKMAANVAANSAGAAYKPPVAGSAAAKNQANQAALAQLLSGKGGQAQLMQLLQQQLLAQPGLTQQQKDMMTRLTQQMGTAQLMAAAALQQRTGQQMTKEQQQALAAALMQQSAKQQSAAAAASSSNNNSAAATSAASAAAASNSGTSTPSASSHNTATSALAAAAANSNAAARPTNLTQAQKLAAARHAFRKTADGQLITTVMPKACPNELFFIPNPNAPDFLYMLGLDQVVGRVLKDKNATRGVSERPYECEECGCDFATGWKAIGSKDDELHLYCETCLRQAQKKKLRHDRNTQLKKIYSKVALQEKEFEKQITDGKLDGMLATVFAQLQGQNAVAQAAARPTAAASPAVQNLSTKPSTPSVPSPAMQKPATPLQSTPSGSKTSSSTNASPSSGTKRPATTATNNQALQNQLAQLAQLARANPMMAAAMMSGGLMGNQAQAQAAAAAAMSYGPMLQQQLQQMQQMQQRLQQASSNSNSNAAKASTSSSSSNAAAAASSSSNSNNSNAAAAASANMAMNMLAQAMQNAQNRSAASSSSNNATANAQMQAMAQLAALTQAGAFSQQSALSSFGNPQQLLRQMQLAAAQMQKNASKK